jgi:DNA-binding PadR family transcriptional regulator
MPRPPQPSTAVYALLGLLAMRSHTGYELTRQARTSLRLLWPTSEANLYRDQQRLVRLGWAEVTTEPVGRRTRKRYRITEPGREALQAWLASPPAAPGLDIEAFVRIWLADQGSVGDLAAALAHTAASARAVINAAAGLAERYLLHEGAFPERAHLNGLAGDLLTATLAELADGCDQMARDVTAWDSTRRDVTSDARTAADTRACLTRIVERATARGDTSPT